MKGEGRYTRRMVYGMLCGLCVARNRVRKYVIESNSLKTEMQSSRLIIRKQSVVVLSCVRYNSSGLKRGWEATGMDPNNHYYTAHSS